MPGMTRPAMTQCHAILCHIHEHAGITIASSVRGLGNQAGDDSSGADTMCDAILCAVNHHVACVACPDGHTRRWRRLHAADTSCTEVTCSVRAVSAGNGEFCRRRRGGSDTQCDLIYARNTHASSTCTPQGIKSHVRQAMTAVRHRARDSAAGVN